MVDNRLRTFDWRPGVPDEGRARWSLSLAPKFDPTIPLRNKRWSKIKCLDQRYEGACVTFAISHTVLGTPKPRFFIEEQDARQMYAWALKNDEFPGEADEGTSVNAGMKAARYYGWIKEWWWLNNDSELKQAVSRFGPVNIGVYWMTGMFDPDSNGIIHSTGNIEGGHSVAIAEIDVNRRLYGIWQSWGPDHGINGTVYIPWDEMDELIFDMAGEAALIREPKLFLGALRRPPSPT